MVSEVPLGKLMAGPPCGLWIYMSRSYHARGFANNYLGDMFQAMIRGANQLMVNTVVLRCVAHSRTVIFEPDREPQEQVEKVRAFAAG